MRKKEVVLIAGVLAVACLLLVINAVRPRQDGRERIQAMLETTGPEQTGSPETARTADEQPSPSPDGQEETAAPEQSEETPEASAAPAGPAKPASAAGPAGPQMAAAPAAVRGYVVITLNGRQYGDPIPMDRDKIITVRQGADKINRIHITPDSVEMDSSTCENQDCVGEGVITLENYKTRILSTYIICLPNGVQVEMVPVDAE